MYYIPTRDSRHRLAYETFKQYLDKCCFRLSCVLILFVCPSLEIYTSIIISFTFLTGLGFLNQCNIRKLLIYIQPWFNRYQVIKGRDCKSTLPKHETLLINSPIVDKCIGFQNGKNLFSIYFDRKMCLYEIAMKGSMSFLGYQMLPNVITSLPNQN